MDTFPIPAGYERCATARAEMRAGRMSRHEVAQLHLEYAADPNVTTAQRAEALRIASILGR